MAWDGKLRSILGGYKHRDLCRQDCMRALHQFNYLTPERQKFTHNDGREVDLLALDGTLPVHIRGARYNIPVCVWLQENHPYIPPLVYVKPTNNMGISVSKHVDANGKVYHPYLTEWTYPKSDLAALLQLLSCIFTEESPVYAKQSEPQPPSSYRPPHQGQFSQPQFGSYPANPMGSTPYPIRGPGMMPVPMPMPGTSPRMSTGVRPPYPPFPQAGGISGGQSTTPYPVNQPNFSAVSTQPSYRPHTGYPPPSTSTGANVVTSNPVSTSSSSNDDAAVKASLRTAVEDKIRRRTKALFGQAQIELDQLNRTQMQLKEGSEKLKDILQKLEKEQADVDNDIKLLTQKNEEITVVVSQLESNSSKLDIDDAVVTTAPLYNQILNLFAEENAVEDTIYYLSESLRKEAIDLDLFLKNVRVLSRKQFMLRALLHKARKTAGLSEVAG